MSIQALFDSVQLHKRQKAEMEREIRKLIVKTLFGEIPEGYNDANFKPVVVEVNDVEAMETLGKPHGWTDPVSGMSDMVSDWLNQVTIHAKITLRTKRGYKP